MRLCVKSSFTGIGCSQASARVYKHYLSVSGNLQKTLFQALKRTGHEFLRDSLQVEISLASFSNPCILFVQAGGVPQLKGLLLALGHK